jgi:hypothetical protein
MVEIQLASEPAGLLGIVILNCPWVDGWLTIRCRCELSMLIHDNTDARLAELLRSAVVAEGLVQHLAMK